MAALHFPASLQFFVMEFEIESRGYVFRSVRVSVGVVILLVPLSPLCFEKQYFSVVQKLDALGKGEVLETSLVTIVQLFGSIVVEVE